MSMAATSPLALAYREDDAVIALVAAGDQHGVLSLYRQHAADVYRFIARRVDGSPEDAEELLQDTMLAAVASATRFRGECSVRTWLCSIARRQILQRRRTDLRKKRVPAACRVSLDEGTMDWIQAA
ncbi:MAG: RNA polymerase sigma factor, partial [Chloroflexi bacterium]|nr:RNA polymerase sigma factor [Chloroflexota bacterium]